MYIEGNIIYFDPFYFKDGNNAKRKYFLVLKVLDQTTILASLPSSINHLPSFATIAHGCLDIVDSYVNCYVFLKDVPVTKNGWSFKFDTFLYGNWIDDYELQVLKQTYQIEGVDYEIVGQLTDVELTKVINCFKDSKMVKRRYKRLLQDK